MSVHRTARKMIASNSIQDSIKAFLDKDFSINLVGRKLYGINFGPFNLELNGLKVLILLVGAIFFIYLFTTKSSTYQAGKTVPVSSENTRSTSRATSSPASSPAPRRQPSKDSKAKSAPKSKTPEKPRAASPSPQPTARRSARGKTPKKN